MEEEQAWNDTFALRRYTMRRNRHMRRPKGERRRYATRDERRNASIQHELNRYLTANRSARTHHARQEGARVM